MARLISDGIWLLAAYFCQFLFSLALERGVGAKVPNSFIWDYPTGIAQATWTTYLFTLVPVG
jgi:hypothetical protein